jgi:hypothetical protein
LAFQAWLAIPSASRDPRSQRELAAQLEVHEVTLSALSRVVGDLVPVLHAQVAAAKKGSLPHAQWLFELCGKWTPKAHVDHAVAANVRIVIETVDDRA